MKQRVLVMNGQRLVQNEKDGQWETDKVDKAGAIKPGIYNIHLATDADQAKAYEGVIIHADKTAVYQQVGKAFIRHDRTLFDKVPVIGSLSRLEYEGNKAIVAATSVKQGKRLSR
jgi:cell filamentation protein